MKRKDYPGYLTVYLSMLLTVLLSLFLVLLEGLRFETICLESECVMDIGMNSVMAEYHRELFGQYNILAVDSSYGTDTAGSRNVEKHLEHYLERNLSNDTLVLSDFLYRDFLSLHAENVSLTQVSLLTDEEGAVFRKRAVEAARDDVGLEAMEKVLAWMQTVDSNRLLNSDVEERRQEVNEGIIQEFELNGVENPFERLNNVRRKGLLPWVLGEDVELSDRVLLSKDLVAARMDRGECNLGNWPGDESKEAVEDAFLFREYLVHYMGNYVNPKDRGALRYQLEYLLIGRDKDADNLKEVADRICILREAANLIHLYSDIDKMEQVKTLATALALLFEAEDAEPMLETAICIAWSSAESIHDVKILLNGGGVPLLKGEEDWYYSLDRALGLSLASDTTVSEKGLFYQDYLRILLMATGERQLTLRAMNVIESDIRTTPGNAAFRLDACMDRIEMYAGIKSGFGYSVDITRGKVY